MPLSESAPQISVKITNFYAEKGSSFYGANSTRKSEKRSGNGRRGEQKLMIFPPADKKIYSLAIKFC